MSNREKALLARIGKYWRGESSETSETLSAEIEDICGEAEAPKEPAPADEKPKAEKKHHK